jgi:hypothetical protein
MLFKSKLYLFAFEMIFLIKIYLFQIFINIIFEDKINFTFIKFRILLK